jgi:hypothetical protein
LKKYVGVPKDEDNNYKRSCNDDPTGDVSLLGKIHSVVFEVKYNENMMDVLQAALRMAA